MDNFGVFNGAQGAEAFGFRNLKGLLESGGPGPLRGIARPRRSQLAKGGALVADTGVHTGRSPKDKFVVRDATHRGRGLVGQQRRDHARAVRALLRRTSSRMPRARSCSRRTSTAAPIRRYRVEARVFTEYAWHSLFIRNLLIRPQREELAELRARADHRRSAVASRPTRRGTAAARETVIACDFTRKIVLIGGTSYAGEMKKSVFTYLNYVLPREGRHADALLGQCRRATATSAIFFGLSGTGKTTLSADPEPHAASATTSMAGAERRLQLRGRLLRQDDPACRARPSRRSTPRPSASAP